VAWLYRRAAFGLAPGELDALEREGYDAALDRLVDPDATGMPPAPVPFSDELMAKATTLGDRTVASTVIVEWLSALRDSPRRLEAWMAWFWHGHFVSGLDKARTPWLMANQVRLFHRAGLGPFAALVRAVTVDPAMLVYLDGVTSSGTAPNENYGRELQELFTVGVDNYEEADVKAAAIALTGWRIDRATGRTFLERSRHDDSPQTLQGRPGVHDLDTVVAAVTGAPACSVFVTGKLSRALLGPDVSHETVAELASEFRRGGLDVRALVRSSLQRGPEGSSPLILSPVAWFLAAERATGVQLRGAVLRPLNAAGQVPMLPPNVGGWPGGQAWLGASTVVARYGLAGMIAAETPLDNPARVAADAGDVAALADALGHPDGFSSPTARALTDLHRSSRNGVGVLALALASPDMALA
jgi:uncharacterized protein (DUF1800 family)